MNDTIKSWKFAGLSIGFHSLIGGLLLFGLNGTLSPKHDFSNAIIVDLVQAGEMINPISPETESQEIPGDKQEPTIVPEPDPALSSESEVPRVDPLTQVVVVYGILDLVTIEQTGPGEPLVDQLVLARIPRSALGTLLGDPLLSRESSGEGIEDGKAVSSEELNRFLFDIRNRLEKAKRYPLLARIRGQEGVVQIGFHISPSGKAKNIRLVQSSDWPILNQEAFKTVTRVNQFGHPPDHWKEGMEVRVPLVFRLEGP